MMKQPAYKAIRNQGQAGFTLIELIVVIVILGILAATALPKFADLGGQARVASLNAVRGALNTSASMIHGQSLLNPSATTITNEGVAVTLASTYPAASSTSNTPQAAGLNVSTDLGAAPADYLVIYGANAGNSTTPVVSAGAFAIVPSSVANTAAALTCNVMYTAATSATVPPTVVVTSTGC
jgi:MSHA pilin protein MshA